MKKRPKDKEIIDLVVSRYARDDDIDIEQSSVDHTDSGGAWVKAYLWVGYAEVPGYEGWDEEAE